MTTQRNREANSFGGDTGSGGDESESSGEGVEMVTSDADDTEVESTPLVSGRAVSTNSRAGSSVHSGVKVRRSPFRKVFEHFQKAEVNELLAVGCFKVVDEKDVPKDRKVVGSRWVHTYKSDGHGNCLKTKSRVVAKGFTQVQDVDYHESTSPTPTSAPVKIIAAAITNEKDLPIFHLDVSQAFVQAPLEEEMYMRLPPGCGELSGKVVNLLKCQYGLKQAGREWHLLLVTRLVEKTGMEQCKAEPCVSRKIIKRGVTDGRGSCR